jgi:hypothetical protein
VLSHAAAWYTTSDLTVVNGPQTLQLLLDAGADLDWAYLRRGWRNITSPMSSRPSKRCADRLITVIASTFDFCTMNRPRAGNCAVDPAMAGLLPRHFEAVVAALATGDVRARRYLACEEVADGRPGPPAHCQ